MNVWVSANGPSSTADTIVSRDGTRLEQRIMGSGPPLIVLPGALSLASDFATLAEALALSFTVHVLERRGHGHSGDAIAGYAIEREVEDVAALLQTTGPAFVFGHSFGGLIALEAARTLGERIRKVAVFEPGVSIGGSIPSGWIPEYKTLLEAGKAHEAFIVFIRALGPEQARLAPRWLMRLTLPFILRGNEWQKMKALLPSNAREHAEVGRLNDSYRAYTGISAPTLLMHGDKDGAVPARTSEALGRVMPKATVRAFPGLDHFAPQRRNTGEVAEALRAFFVGGE